MLLFNCIVELLSTTQLSIALQHIDYLRQISILFRLPGVDRWSWLQCKSPILGSSSHHCQREPVNLKFSVSLTVKVHLLTGQMMQQKFQIACIFSLCLVFLPTTSNYVMSMIFLLSTLPWFSLSMTYFYIGRQLQGLSTNILIETSFERKYWSEILYENAEQLDIDGRILIIH